MIENNSSQTCLLIPTSQSTTNNKGEEIKKSMEQPSTFSVDNLDSEPLFSCEKDGVSEEVKKYVSDASTSTDADDITCLSLSPYEIKIGRETVDISFGKIANSSRCEKKTEIDRWCPHVINKENYLLITPKRNPTNAIARKRKANWVEQRSRRHFEAIIFNLRRRTYFLATCDVLVNISACSFPCHSLVLMSQSNYFLKVLKGIKKADVQRNHSFIQVPLDHLKVTPDSFRVIYTWLYTSSLTLDESNIAEIWADGMKLKMLAVINLCRREVHRILNPTNALSLWDSADNCGLTELCQMAAHISAWNFSTVTHSGRFLQFDIIKVIRLLRDDNFRVLNFKDIREAAQRWLDYQQADRTITSEELFDNLCDYFKLSHSKKIYKNG